jgi:hypothetical protein
MDFSSRSPCFPNWTHKSYAMTVVRSGNRIFTLEIGCSVRGAVRCNVSIFVEVGQPLFKQVWNQITIFYRMLQGIGVSWLAVGRPADYHDLARKSRGENVIHNSTAP